MDNRHTTGIFLIILSVILFLSTFSLASKLSEATHLSCPAEPSECPFEGAFIINTEGYIGFGAAIIVGLVGVYLLMISKEGMKPQKIKSKKLADLKKDEKDILKIVSDSEGAIFQGELVEKSGMSKVKVTRILDRLEGKGFVERKRRGMSNVVLLKHS